LSIIITVVFALFPIVVLGFCEETVSTKDSVPSKEASSLIGITMFCSVGPLGVNNIC
jgi:hypothetical protein